MSSRAKAGLMLAAWVLAVGAIIMWGAKHLWVAGLGVIVVSLTTFAYTSFSDVGPREKQQYTVAGLMGLVFGAVLLYIGIKNP